MDLVIFIEAICNSKSRVKIIERFEFVDEMFSSNLKVVIAYRREKWDIFVRILILLFIVIFIKVSVFLYLFYQNNVYNFNGNVSNNGRPFETDANIVFCVFGAI